MGKPGGRDANSGLRRVKKRRNRRGYGALGGLFNNLGSKMKGLLFVEVVHEVLGMGVQFVICVSA